MLKIQNPTAEEEFTMPNYTGWRNQVNILGKVYNWLTFLLVVLAYNKPG